MSRYSKTRLRAGQTPADVPQKKPPIRRSIGSAISAEEEDFLLGELAEEPTVKHDPDPPLGVSP